MKILVMSDSHSALRFMRMSIDRIKPDHVVHLGDLYEDAQALQEEYPHIRFHMVPGNCDSSFIRNREPAVLCYDVGGVRLFMTHGHLHGVKSAGVYRLLKEARELGAQAALYGHTHVKHCSREEDGIWVVNPGSCRGDHGSVALIETRDGNISACTILEQTDILDL
ncbi:MAG: YfcE family phosphodiesterase [Oscillospiraceae bacterium]|nr:YfcE family phosphodiesterase [Oscillospiraceae bacterium]